MGFEPTTFGSTVRCSNQLSYAPKRACTALFNRPGECCPLYQSFGNSGPKLLADLNDVAGTLTTSELLLHMVDELHWEYQGSNPDLLSYSQKFCQLNYTPIRLGWDSNPRIRDLQSRPLNRSGTQSLFNYLKRRIIVLVDPSQIIILN